MAIRHRRLVAIILASTLIGAASLDAQTLSAERRGSTLAFEANRGQFNPDVRFVARGRGYTLLLRDSDASIRSTDGASDVRLSIGRCRAGSSRGLDQEPGLINYLIGNDPTRWHVGVPIYGRVRCESAFPGVDVDFYSRDGLHEYDLIVDAGANPAVISIGITGARSVAVDPAGHLQLETAGQTITMRAPVVYQLIGGARHDVGARYVLNDATSIGFALDHYDRAAPLVIDPQLVYGTFLGGSGNSTDLLHGVDTDAAGNAYVVGSTDATDYPAQGSIQPLGGNTNVVVTKFAPDGRRIYSTIFGGSGYDGGSAIAVRSDGTAYVVGATTSADFPVRDGFQRDFGGATDAFIVELNREGAAIVRGTYLGGSDADSATGLELALPLEEALATSGQLSIFDDILFVYGSTKSPNFPTLHATQDRRIGERDGFLTVFDRQTLQARFSSYAGLEGENRADSLIINHGKGDVYLWLYRGDDSLGPVFAHFIPPPGVASAARISAQKYKGENFSNSVMGRFGDENFGNLPVDRIRALFYTAKPAKCVPGTWRDSQGRLHVKPGDASKTLCTDVFGQAFRAQGGVFSPAATSDQLSRAVLTVFAAGCVPVAPATTCSERAYVMFLDENLKKTAVVNIGGQGVGRNFVPTAMAVGPDGFLHFIGTTADTNLPVVNPVQAGYVGSAEGFILSIDPLTNTTRFFSYLGGGSFDTLTDIAVDLDGNLWIVGETLSADFPTTRSGVQPEMRGRIDGFVVKIGQ